MRILLIMNPGLPVPPVLYGGIERIVYLLAEEYHKLGHEVTLLSGPDSYCSGTTITFGNNSKTSKWTRNKEIYFVWKYLTNNHKAFDLIHNFGRLVYFLPVLNKPVFKLMTYERPVSKSGIKIVSALPVRNLIFTGCSNFCVSTGNVSGKWATVYNGVDFSQYQLNDTVKDDAPLMFLGRMEKIKGLHTAIKVAKATGHKLIIGGNIPENPDYFKTEIEPQIDNDQIKYLGPLNDGQKNEYLGQAKALLFPIEWDEPFGIVMIEAMACGTPVIAFNRGSVTEVITQQTGLKVNTPDEMIAAVKEVNKLNRRTCRNLAERNFDISVIAHEYLKCFKIV
ncbi:MAG: hypothetical protein JWP44_3645 [Mucilaginibacter sp.]|nr:hypothetical protein [Mucilaginibacter sp.]